MLNTICANCCSFIGQEGNVICALLFWWELISVWFIWFGIQVSIFHQMYCSIAKIRRKNWFLLWLGSVNGGGFVFNHKPVIPILPSINIILDLLVLEELKVKDIDWVCFSWSPSLANLATLVFDSLPILK